jgi:P27 family predicted phage terminase small subunit
MARPRKPIATKIQKGTYREDRDGPKSQVVPTRGTPLMPESLTGAARDFWREMVPKLVETGVVGEADGPALTVLCESWQRYRMVAGRLTEFSTAEEMAELIPAANAAAKAWESLAGRFGLTPSDRTKIRAEQGAMHPAKVQARKRG